MKVDNKKEMIFIKLTLPQTTYYNIRPSFVPTRMGRNHEL